MLSRAGDADDGSFAVVSGRDPDDPRLGGDRDLSRESGLQHERVARGSVVLAASVRLAVPHGPAVLASPTIGLRWLGASPPTPKHTGTLRN